MRPSGGGAIAPFVALPPAPHPEELDQQGRIERLRALLAAIERPRDLVPAPEVQPAGRLARVRWTLGDPEVDGWLPDGQLDPASLSEIKPQAYGDTPAALSFALLLAARRLGMSGSTVGGTTMPPGLVVWCWPHRLIRESGSLYGPGLARLGIDPGRLLLVETATPAETLWAMEESLASGAAAIVIGCLDAIDLTPARRLALAAAAHGTPALAVTAARTSAAAATSARWRIAAAPSAPHAFDPMAPGDPRFRLTLERCRGRAMGAMPPSSVVEWSHDADRNAYRFRVAAGVVHRAPAAATGG